MVRSASRYRSLSSQRSRTLESSSADSTLAGTIPSTRFVRRVSMLRALWKRGEHLGKIEVLLVFLEACDPFMGLGCHAVFLKPCP